MAVDIGTLAEEAFWNVGGMALEAGQQTLMGQLGFLGSTVKNFANTKILGSVDSFFSSTTNSSTEEQPSLDLKQQASELGFFALQSLYFTGTGLLTSFGTNLLFRNQGFALLAAKAFKHYAPLLVSQIGSFLTTPIWQLGLQVATGQPLHLPSGEELAMSTLNNLGNLATRMAPTSKPKIIPTFTQVFNKAIPNNSGKASRPKGNHDIKDFYSWLENVHLGSHFNNPKYVGKTYSFSYKETRDCVSQLKVHHGDMVPTGVTGICFRVEEAGKIRITNVVGKESEKAAITLGKNPNHSWEPNENWERACLLTIDDTLLEGWGAQKIKYGRAALPPGTVYEGLANKEIFDRIAKLPILRHQAETDPPKPLKAQIYFGRLDRKKSDDKEAPAPFGRFAVRKPTSVSKEEIGIDLEITSTGQEAELIPTWVHNGEYITDWDTKRALSLNEAFAWERLAQTHPDFHRKLACAALDDIYLDSLPFSKMVWGPVEANDLKRIINSTRKENNLNQRGIFTHHPDQSIAVTLWGYHDGGLCTLEGFSSSTKTRKENKQSNSFDISVSFTKNKENIWELTAVEDHNAILTFSKGQSSTLTDVRETIRNSLTRLYGAIPEKGFVIGTEPRTYTFTASALETLQADELRKISNGARPIDAIPCPLYYALLAQGHVSEATALRQTMNTYYGMTTQNEGRSSLGLDLAWDPSVNALRRIASDQTPEQRQSFLADWFRAAFGHKPKRGEIIYVIGAPHKGNNWHEERIPRGFLSILDESGYAALPPKTERKETPYMAININEGLNSLVLAYGVGNQRYIDIFREYLWINR